MGSAAMDALKYGGYLTSGLYASSASAGLSDGSSADNANNSKSYSQMSPASKQYLDSSSKLYGLDPSGQMQQQLQQQQQQSASHLKASSYTADSLSRSYFDAVQRAGYGQQQLQEPGKSYTPDTTASGRASADSPDSSCNNKSGGNNSESQNLMLGAEASHQLQQHAASFSNHHSHHQAAALQAYYNSQNVLSGMSGGHGAGVPSSGSAGSMVNGSSMAGAGLPPLLPMAAQLSQYASAAGSYNSQAAAAAAAAAASGEYRRPLSVLF
jgi:hypothetical protein